MPSEVLLLALDPLIPISFASSSLRCSGKRCRPTSSLVRGRYQPVTAAGRAARQRARRAASPRRGARGLGFDQDHRPSGAHGRRRDDRRRGRHGDRAGPRPARTPGNLDRPYDPPSLMAIPCSESDSCPAGIHRRSRAPCPDRRKRVATAVRHREWLAGADANG